MNGIIDEKNSDGLYYSIRLLIRHPRLTVQVITMQLGIAPTYAWDIGDPGRFDTMWSLETWTEGDRNFFGELDDILCWLEGRPAVIGDLLADGGKITIIAQLSGQKNIGDELSIEAMARASALGVGIGVEVFPKLRRPRAG